MKYVGESTVALQKGVSIREGGGEGVLGIGEVMRLMKEGNYRKLKLTFVGGKLLLLYKKLLLQPVRVKVTHFRFLTKTKE